MNGAQRMHRVTVEEQLGLIICLLQSIRDRMPEQEAKPGSRTAFEARQVGPQPDHERPIWATVRIGEPASDGPLTAGEIYAIQHPYDMQSDSQTVKRLIVSGHLENRGGVVYRTPLGEAVRKGEENGKSE